MLAFDGVSRRYGPTLALDGVSFRLEPGTLTAIAGANGAGKSTLLRLAARLERPSAGRVHVDRRDLAWLGQDPGLYDDLTVRENLAFVARFHGRAEEVEPAARALGIGPKLDERARALSRGERQRAALARALVCGPLLLLDEPTAALDAEGAATCARLLVDLRGPRTLLVATHDPAILAAADLVLRLERGRLTA